MHVLRAIALAALVAVPSFAQAADTTAPTVSISSPTDDATVSGTVAVIAQASDNVGVSRVEFFIDGSFRGADSTSPYSFSWDTTKSWAGWHSIAARVLDAAGNAAWASSINVKVSNVSAPPPPGPTSDSTAPTVSITSPANNATVSGTIDVAAEASDNVGVVRVDFYVDGALRGSDSGSPYTFSWNTTTTWAGWHSLNARAVDAAGNGSWASARNVNVNNASAPPPPGPTSDTTAPTVSITSPANTAIVSGTVAVTAEASDNVGVARVDFYVDGAFRGSDSGSPYTFSWSTTTTWAGWHSLNARAVDAAGNAKWAGAINVNVNNASAPPPPGPTSDTTAPTVSITSPASNATVSGAVAVTAEASDNVGVVRVDFYVDGTFRGSDSVSPYVFGWDTTTTWTGWHSLAARALDAAGNATWASGRSVKVDNTAEAPPPPPPGPPPPPTDPIWQYSGADPVGAGRGWWQIHWVPARNAIIVAMGNSHNYSGDNSVRLYYPHAETWTTLVPHGYWQDGSRLHNRDSANTFFIPALGAQGQYWVMGGQPQEEQYGGVFDVAQERWTKISATAAELFAGLVAGAGGGPRTDGTTAWCPDINTGIWWGGSNGSTFVNSGMVIEPNPTGPEPYRAVTIPAGGPEPRWRILNSSACAGDSVYVYAGDGLGSGYLNDLWRFHIPTRTWTQLASGGPGGPDVALAYDAARNLIIAAGRVEPTSDRVYATYSPETNSWSAVTPDPFAPYGNFAGTYAPSTVQTIWMNGWSVNAYGNP